MASTSGEKQVSCWLPQINTSWLKYSRSILSMVKREFLYMSCNAPKSKRKLPEDSWKHSTLFFEMTFFYGSYGNESSMKRRSCIQFRDHIFVNSINDLSDAIFTNFPTFTGWLNFDLAEFLVLVSLRAFARNGGKFFQFSTKTSHELPAIWLCALRESVYVENEKSFSYRRDRISQRLPPTTKVTNAFTAKRLEGCPKICTRTRKSKTKHVRKKFYPFIGRTCQKFWIDHVSPPSIFSGWVAFWDFSFAFFIATINFGCVFFHRGRVPCSVKRECRPLPPIHPCITVCFTRKRGENEEKKMRGDGWEKVPKGVFSHFFVRVCVRRGRKLYYKGI